MRINNVQNIQRNEIVVVNRRPSFQAQTSQISKKVINRLGINMEYSIEHPKPVYFKPAPEAVVGKDLAKFFNALQVDWRTHIDPAKHRRRFE